MVGQPRIYAYHDPKFWEPYRKTPAWEFARFLALVDRGTPAVPPPAISAMTREREDVEASLRWTKALLTSMDGL